MGSSDRYAVQTFNTTRKGELREGRSIPCKNADEARDKAQRSLERGGAAGAAALLLKGDDYLGATEDPIVFATFGSVPPRFTDQLPF